MKLSVIIPSRNRVENLKLVLEALVNQSSIQKDDYEIVIVDDNSIDDTQTVINQIRDRVNLKYIFSNIPKPHTWNAAIIRNLGALISSSETTHFLFVDSDVVLPENALKLYLEDIERISNRVLIGPYDFYDKNNESIKIPDVRNKKFEETTVDQTFDTVHDGLACFGGNLLIPKDIFWSVKGFSVDTHIGLEDGDMGLKLWKAKTKFSYEHRARGKHLWHEIPPDRFPPDMKNHIDNLNLKHFHSKDPDYGIIEASRETYASWGITGWDPPTEWTKGRLEFMMKVNKE